MINKLLIKPDQDLGKGITSFMLTKKYFDKHLIEFNDNSAIEEFIISTLGVPIVWMDQVPVSYTHLTLPTILLV